MTDFPTRIDPAIPEPLRSALATAFPTSVPQPERIVLDYVRQAAAGALGAFGQLHFYGDGRPDQPQIPVRPGWVAYPGKLPAIGVADSTDNDDAGEQSSQGGWLGEVAYLDPTTHVPVAVAGYWGESLTSTTIVQLAHENRDERDRLHVELRRALMPLRRLLPQQDPLIFSASVASEKDEATGGPPVAAQPFLVYLSHITITTSYELRQPGYIDVTLDGARTRIEVEAVQLPDSSAPPD